MDLATTSKAVAEAYLRNDALTKGEFNKDSYYTPPLASNIATPPTTGPATSTATPASTSTATTGSASATTGATTSRTTGIKLLDILQNYTIHLMLATQIEERIYDKHLAHLGPRRKANSLTSEVVKQVEKRKMRKNKKLSLEEIIWKMQQVTAKNYNKQQPRPSSSTSKNNASENPTQGQGPLCFNCGKAGHLKKDCDACTVCKKRGHAAKDCRSGKSSAAGARRTQSSKSGNIRVVTDGNQPGDSPDNTDYESNVYEESSSDSSEGEQERL